MILTLILHPRSIETREGHRTTVSEKKVAGETDLSYLLQKGDSLFRIRVVAGKCITLEYTDKLITRSRCGKESKHILLSRLTFKKNCVAVPSSHTYLVTRHEWKGGMNKHLFLQDVWHSAIGI